MSHIIPDRKIPCEPVLWDRRMRNPRRWPGGVGRQAELAAWPTREASGATHPKPAGPSTHASTRARPIGWQAPERRSAAGPFPRRRRSAAASHARIAHWQSTTRCTTPIAGNASAHLASHPTRRLTPTCPSASSAVPPRSPSSLPPFLTAMGALPVTGWRVSSPAGESGTGPILRSQASSPTTQTTRSEPVPLSLVPLSLRP
jgi:hypothetical protein